jgi:hypothetical protein
MAKGVGLPVPVGSKIPTSPYGPDRFWGPSSLLFNGYRELFFWGIYTHPHGTIALLEGDLTAQLRGCLNTTYVITGPVRYAMYGYGTRVIRVEWQYYLKLTTLPPLT